jgi:UDP-glucose 4-epimerase
VKALVTGGCGFIGSNLVRALLEGGDEVTVLDNLSTGSARNLEGDHVRLVEGDIRDRDALRPTFTGADVVYHLAALPTVARSLADPFASHEVNATGTLNVLIASRDAGVRRLVYASSSSIYGDAPELPKREDMPARPRSPYAASKLAGEAYARSFVHAFGLETVSLRFFNVFGPRQDPTSEYAAVIPRFISRMLDGEPPVVFGDGTNSRDFTFIDNAVQACRLAAGAGPGAVGQVINVACGERITLLELIDALNHELGTVLRPTFAEPRPGDVQHSLAAIEKAERLLAYRPTVSVYEGVARTARWLAGRRPSAVLTDEGAI